MTYKGWKLEVAERGDRIYAVRIVKYIEGSEKAIKAEISKVNDSRVGVHTSSKITQTLLKPR